MEIKRNNFSLIIAGLSISIGLATCGFYIGRSIERFKSHDRTVVVRGISERVVKSDLAVWVLNLKRSGNDLKLIENEIDKDTFTVLKFLKELGFSESEIKVCSPKVIDKTAREFGDSKDHENRYIMELNFTVRTMKIDSLLRCPSKLGQLIKEGLVITGNTYFYYTKFKEIRPEMVAESTKSARTVAEQFAKDSNSQIDSIKTATQGAFTICGQDSYGDSSDYNEIGSVEKSIRVVSTVTFNLKN